MCGRFGVTVLYSMKSLEGLRGYFVKDWDTRRVITLIAVFVWTSNLSEFRNNVYLYQEKSEALRDTVENSERTAGHLNL